MKTDKLNLILFLNHSLIGKFKNITYSLDQITFNIRENKYLMQKCKVSGQLPLNKKMTDKNYLKTTTKNFFQIHIKNNK